MARNEDSASIPSPDSRWCNVGRDRHGSRPARTSKLALATQIDSPFILVARGAIGLVGALAPLWFFRGGLSPVASLLQIALGALVVATATSTASTVERIARLRCATGDLNGREQLRAATAGSRSWIIWAFCMCAVLLYSWIRQWSDASSSGGLGLSSFNEVAALSSAGSCSVWIGLLLWLRQFLAAKRELVRWTNE